MDVQYNNTGGVTMIEALWSVEFRSNLGLGGRGVAVFETGRVLGGDAAMTYVGSFKVENGMVHARLHVQRYADSSQTQSVMGVENFDLELTGKADHDKMTFMGHVVQDPQRKIVIVTTRQAELP